MPAENQIVTPRKSALKSARKSPEKRAPPTIDIESLDDSQVVNKQSRWRAAAAQMNAYPSSDTVETPNDQADPAFDDDSSVRPDSMLTGKPQDDEESFTTILQLASYATPSKGQRKLVDSFF